MASLPTQRLGLEKQGKGDNSDAWGDRLNTALDLVDESQGVAAIVVNGPVTLSATNYLSNQARRMVLRLTGDGGFPVTIPAREKAYLIDNQCAADVILKTSSTSGATVLAGTARWAYCDGANVRTDDSAGASAGTTAFNPSGTLAATNVQAAIAELDGKRGVYTNSGGVTISLATVDVWYDITTALFVAKAPVASFVSSLSFRTTASIQADVAARISLDDITAEQTDVRIGYPHFGTLTPSDQNVNHAVCLAPVYAVSNLVKGRGYRAKLQANKRMTAEAVFAQNPNLIVIVT